MEKVMNGVVSGVLEAVFPTTCVGCGKEGSYVCARCEGFISEVGLICPLCQQSSLAGERHIGCVSRYGLDGLASCWEYEGLVKSLLNHIKYNGITHATGETMSRAFRVVARDDTRFGPFLSFLASSDTRVIYVPMHQRKERRRGFNQAALFAKELAKIAGKEAFDTLEKISDTKPQVDLAKEERLQNVKDAFALSHAPDLRNVQKLVLVDDVWTTGATMKECCKVLKSAGVEQVWGFTIARTP